MTIKDELNPYQDRGHALVKHKLFQKYFDRFVMIVGRTHPKLAYVDAFAGPWMSSVEGYKDTSFGRSVDSIESCSATLAKQFGKRPRFRSLFIEADGERFKSLEGYAHGVSKNTATVEARNCKFEEVVGEIAEWIGDDKAFVLVDPKGYDGLISPDVLKPLLDKPNVELLINYMWQFIVLAVGHTRKIDTTNVVKADLFDNAAAPRRRRTKPNAKHVLISAECQPSRGACDASA